ncbi:MAG TPA: c-type cytochrome [Bacteroidota bacterium]|nr:c-type cytochrome [Bacteroidota bacterium]
MILWLNVLLLLALQIPGDRGAGRASEQQETATPDSVRHALLISDTTGMETAWTVPRDPSTQSLPADSALAAQIRHGFELFTKTSQKAPRFSASILSCSNCHLNAGQREKALPLVGVAGLFPEHNKRAGRAISLEERIIGCFLRSENATGVSGADTSRLPGVRSEEVEALAAYIHWISDPVSSAHPPSWRGQNTIAKKNLITISALDRRRGRALFREWCANCHGKNGEGVQIGDKRAGPLWGPHSWNDGAGMARVYTLAGFIRYAMPYLAPGTLNDKEAQEIATYINSQPRPAFPFKDRDYPGQKVPEDAVYYPSGKK